MSSFYLALFASLPLVLAGAHIPSTGSVSVSISIGAGGATTSPASYTTTKQCIRDSCARQVADGLRQYQAPARSSDCAALFKPITVTPSPVTITVPLTPSPIISIVTSSISTSTIFGTTSLQTFIDPPVTRTSTVYSTSTSTETQVSQTITTSTATLTTTVAGATITAAYGKRGEAKVPQWACDCPDNARLSSACACAGFQPRTVTASAKTVYVTVPVTTPTSTSFIIGQTTQTLGATSPVFIKTTTTSLTTIITQTTTTTSSVSTSSSITTTVATVGAAPSGTVGYCSDGTVVDGLSTGRTGGAAAIRPFRIEAEFETLFEGFILSAPQNITTPSGGTHLCDGTNNNANPAPIVTGTDQIADAGRLCGFGFDGVYSNNFQDFFINNIGSSTSTGSKYWGILDNLVFTPTGGCQYGVYPGSSILWAYDAFAPNRAFLRASPAEIQLQAGQVYTFSITAANPNNGNEIPAAGASFGGGNIADANGNVQFVAPTTPGTYRYKATRSNAIRSNAVIITVTA